MTAAEAGGAPAAPDGADGSTGGLRRAYIMWALGCGLLALLALAYWLVYPVWHTRRVVAGVHEINVAIRNSGGTMDPVKADLCYRQNGVDQLGGQRQAAILMGQYLHRSEYLAPHKQCAIAILAYCGHQGVAPLCEALHNPDPLLRRWAALALCDLGLKAETAIPELAQALGDDDETVRTYSAYAIGKMGPRARQAIPKLVELIERQDLPETEWHYVPKYPNLRVEASRATAVEALALVDPEGNEVLAVLEKALDHEDEAVRHKAASGLERLGPVAKSLTTVLEKKLAGKNGSEVIKAYWRITGNVDKPIARIIQDYQSDRTMFAARAELILEIDVVDERTIPMLIEYLKTGDDLSDLRTSAAVARALGNAGPAAKQAVPMLEKLLTYKKTLASPAAAEALRNIRGEQPDEPPKTSQ